MVMLWRCSEERKRVRALRQLGALDDLSEPAFDRFVQQAADAFSAPMALLTLLDDTTLWVKASKGLLLTCVPRDQGFCTVAIECGQPLEVCDALQDPRFNNLGAVTSEPHVRYYLGAPVRLFGGTDVGALCVVDTRVRAPASRDQRAFLMSLARQAGQALEERSRIIDGLAI